jgi:DNA-binding transcriptional regulator YiaG
MITAADIRVARARLGEDQTAFASRFNVDQATISRWEREGLPDKGPSMRLAEYVLAELSAQASQAAE